MGVIQSGAACVVSQQSEADEITGRNELWPDAGPSGAICPLAPGLCEPVSRSISQVGEKPPKTYEKLSTFSACFFFLSPIWMVFQNQWRAKKINSLCCVLVVTGQTNWQ